MNTRRAVAGIFEEESGGPGASGVSEVLARFPWPGLGPVAAATDGPCTLGVRAAGGASAILARLPGPGLLLAGDLRIDNRPELLDLLALPGPERAGLDDAALMLRLWEARGEAALGLLEGDFAILLWDRRRGRLFAARDVMGARPLFWAKAGPRVAVAGSARALVLAGVVPLRLDEVRVASFLVDVLELHDREGTFFEGVRRLLPGHLLEAGPGGAVVRRFRSIEPPGPGETLLRGGEAVEGFRAILRRSVADRVGDGRGVGSMLSGGLDSSSIVALARDLLREGGGPPLRTFSAIEAEGEPPVEGPWIRAVLAQGGVEPTVLLPSDAASFLDEVRAAPASFEEPFDGGVGAVPLLMMLAARRAGLDVLLDGVDGDLAISLNEECIGHAVAEGRWGLAWSLARGFGRYYGMSGMGLFLRKGVAPRAPRFLKAAWRRLRPAENGWEESLTNSCIHPDLAARTGIRERLRAMAATVSPNFGVGDAAALSHATHRASGPWLTPGVERYGRASASLGLEARHPLADARVATFGLRIHWEEKVRGGRRKAVLAGALNRLLPDTVLGRGIALQNLNPRFAAALLQAGGPSPAGEVEEALGRRGGIIHKSFIENRLHSTKVDASGASIDALLGLDRWTRGLEPPARAGVP